MPRGSKYKHVKYSIECEAEGNACYLLSCVIWLDVAFFTFHGSGQFTQELQTALTDERWRDTVLLNTIYQLIQLTEIFSA
jgi:hypothetical protein